MGPRDIALQCTLKLIDEDVPTTVTLRLRPPPSGSLLLLRAEFELPGRPMWFASWFDRSELLGFAEALDALVAERRGLASLWDVDRMLHLYFQELTERGGTVGFCGFSYDYHLAEDASKAPEGSGEEQLPDLLEREQLGLEVAFQGLTLPRAALAGVASDVRRFVAEARPPGTSGAADGSGAP